ncbi:glutamic acid-rich protein-like [Lineus longissimus]|uniref:glutamic acid-rich protein-like n=1 Tax=Lineus longissimus TaxID=88925 RepID=UPI00315CCC10
MHCSSLLVIHLVLVLISAALVPAAIIQPQDLGNGVHSFHAPNAAGTKSFKNIVGFAVGADGEKKAEKKETKTFGGKFSQCPLGFKNKKNSGTCMPDGSEGDKCSDGQVKNEDGLCVMKVKVPRKLVQDMRKLKAESNVAQTGPCNTGYKKVNGICVLPSALHKLKKVKLLSDAEKEVDGRKAKVTPKTARHQGEKQLKVLIKKVETQENLPFQKNSKPRKVLLKTTGKPLKKVKKAEAKPQKVVKIARKLTNVANNKRAGKRVEVRKKVMGDLVKSAGKMHMAGKPRKVKINAKKAQKVHVVKTTEKPLEVKCVDQAQPELQKTVTAGKPQKVKKCVVPPQDGAKEAGELLKAFKTAEKLEKAKKADEVTVTVGDKDGGDDDDDDDDDDNDDDDDDDDDDKST